MCYASYNVGKYYVSRVIRTAIRSLPNIDWLYLADISLSDKIWNEIEPDVKGLNICLIDHHETSANATSFKDKINVNLDMDVSAAKLFYRLFEKSCPRLHPYSDFIDAVSAYDTWHFEKSPIAKDLQRIFDCIAFQDPALKFVKFSDRLSKFTNMIINDTITNKRMPIWCESCLDLYYKLTTPKMEYAKRECISIYKDVATVNLFSEDNIPLFELSWYLEENYPEAKNMIYVINQKNGDCNISIRTRYDDDSVDVSKIAEKHGGGGHQKAAAISSVSATEKYDIINSVKTYLLEAHNK